MLEVVALNLRGKWLDRLNYWQSLTMRLYTTTPYLVTQDMGPKWVGDEIALEAQLNGIEGQPH